MSGAAQVRSADAIEALNLALARFAERLQNALDGLDGQLHRADAWIDHDRPSYWRTQTREAEDGLHQAKLDLERCLLMTTVDGQRPACREQKAAVAEARSRVDYCREKSELVKKWQRSFRHESLEYQGRIGQLRRIVEQDVPSARAVLIKIARRLEEYQLERPPEAADSPSSGSTPEATTRSAASTSASPAIAPTAPIDPQ